MAEADSVLSFNNFEMEPENVTQISPIIKEELPDKEVCVFYLAGKCRFGAECRNKHEDPAIDLANNSVFSKSKRTTQKPQDRLSKKQKLKLLKQSVEDAETQTTKKPSMKTAVDVISRIQWDDLLCKEYFKVGYLDRFLGIVEKPFLAFDWSDPSIVDNYTLAIPKHRIHYFKYKHKKVWDKNERLDAIFGSTGSDISISDLMKEVDEEEKIMNKKGLEVEEREIDDEMSSIYSDESYSDDSVEVHIQEGAKTGETVTSFCTHASEIKENSDRSRTKSQFESYHNNIQPNFFIAVRLTEPDVLDKILEVRDHIQSLEPVLKECCMNRETFHLTLSMLHLESVAEINQASRAIHLIKDELCDFINPHIELQLRGLDNFEQRVVYVCVENQPSFITFVEKVQQLLEREGVTLANNFSFVPHVTLLKVNRPVSRLRRTKYIDPSLYLKFAQNHFGSMKIDNIHLCEIGDHRRKDGFYQCVTQLTL
ncbi:uncharacterized protein LOC106474741 [Limulus polyphemus]|uniref:Uncharacterized protein LOC106474741 n=1 Tax=Limulus polyphemus TaxID=6850 RepID=A0ABM1BY44_LIMPO|nr:uncharacterized protein LOC106474741 [Limulus polyphemus]